MNYITQFGKANKEQIRVLLADKLPDTMAEAQKDRKILSFLTKLRQDGIIVRDSESRQHSYWIMKRKMVNENQIRLMIFERNVEKIRVFH